MTSPTWPHARQAKIDYSDPMGAVDQLTEQAHGPDALDQLGDPTTRRALALIKAGDMTARDGRWIGAVALEYLRIGRPEAAQTWARAQSIMDEAARNR